MDRKPPTAPLGRKAPAIRRVAVLTPVLDDWRSLTQLIKSMESRRRAAAPDLRCVYVAVDDGSQERFSLEEDEPPEGCELHIVRLKANQGHQRAIALGLAHVERELDVDAVLVMDADGEDRPEDALRLISHARQNPGAVICAARMRRSEGVVFRAFYFVYKIVFGVLTGRAITFGNFSLIPIDRLPNVIYSQGIWNNLAATLLRCRAPILFVPTVRGSRYFGSSKMNFVSLVLHGISVISVFSDVVIARVIIVLGAMFMILSAGIAVTLFVKLGTTTFIPGYATNVILFLANMIVTTSFIGFGVVIMLLNARAMATSLPTRLYDDLVRDVTRLVSRASAAAATEEAAEETGPAVRAR
jgi:glycosyltransferase involved in cell wall biosynthesis